MSFYSISNNPVNFVNKDPQQQVLYNLANINATFTFPVRSITIDAGTATYTAEQMLGTYILRKNSTGNDTTDTATNIINACRAKVRALSNLKQETIPNGFSFSFMVYKDASCSGNDELLGGTGVTFGVTGDLYKENVTQMRAVVVGQTALGDSADHVSIINFVY
jgi:hypothetical protein